MPACGEPLVVNVLIVEDNPGDLFLMKETIEHESGGAVRIDVSTDGEAVVAMVRSGELKPDLIVLDLNLPKMDGLQLLRELRKMNRYVPVVVLTTSGSPRDLKSAFELGASAFVTKPIGFDAFLLTMKNVCSSWVEPIRRVKAASG